MTGAAKTSYTTSDQNPSMEVDRELRSLRVRNQALEDTMHKTVTELEVMKIKMADNERMVDKWKLEMERSKREAYALEKEKADVAKRVAEAKKVVAEAEGREAELQRRVEHLTSQLSVAETDKHRLQSLAADQEPRTQSPTPAQQSMMKKAEEDVAVLTDQVEMMKRELEVERAQTKRAEQSKYRLESEIETLNRLRNSSEKLIKELRAELNEKPRVNTAQAEALSSLKLQLREKTDDHEKALRDVERMERQLKDKDEEFESLKEVLKEKLQAEATKALDLKKKNEDLRERLHDTEDFQKLIKVEETKGGEVGELQQKIENLHLKLSEKKIEVDNLNTLLSNATQAETAAKMQKLETEVLQQRIRALEQTVTIKDKELLEMGEVGDERGKKLKELNDRIDNLKKDNEQLRDEIDSGRGSTEVDRLNALLDMKDQEVVRMTARLDEYRQRASDINTEMKNLEVAQDGMHQKLGQAASLLDDEGRVVYKQLLDVVHELRDKRADIQEGGHIWTQWEDHNEN